jgi:hypothetical protein
MQKPRITFWVVGGLIGAILVSIVSGMFGLLNDAMIQIGWCQNGDALCLLYHYVFTAILLLVISLFVDLIIVGMFGKLILYFRTPNPKNIKLSSEMSPEGDILLRICNQEWRKPFMEYFSEVKYDGGNPDNANPLKPNYYHSFGAGGGIFPEFWKLNWTSLKNGNIRVATDDLLVKNKCATVDFIKFDSETNTFRIDADYIGDIKFPLGIYQFTVKVTGISNGVENKKRVKNIVHRVVKISVTYKGINQTEIDIV